MSRTFLSHSSVNNAEAIAIRDWMLMHGWDDLFLDIDPKHGLVSGDRWEAELRQAASRCECVIFLLSRAWLDSQWCRYEFHLARQLNKRLFAVLIEDIPIADLPEIMTREWQITNLAVGERHTKFDVEVPPGPKHETVSFADEGLERLKIGLMKAGLDPKYFAWPPVNDPKRTPYRGFKPLEAEDAGIFFGRDGSIVEALDLLRGLRDAPSPRLLVILGASGAGKSSFMRAGLLPRLSRDDRNFVDLPVIRPERAVITGETGLIACLEKAMKDAGLTRTRAKIRSAVEGGVDTIRPILTQLVEARTSVASIDNGAKAKPPTLILPIDQSEELFIAGGAEEGEQFLTLLRELLSSDEPALIALFTIRSDNYEPLQSAKPLEGLRKVPFDLSPMPKGSFANVIEGPAQRLEGTNRPLIIEEQLVNALLTDIEVGGAKDALPLLAFTLGRLYREYGGDGRLTLMEYEECGRVKGSIEAAVERALQAADGNATIPQDRNSRMALLRRGLIPWVASLDPDTGAPHRCVARISELPEEALPLIELLVDQRLLATDVSKDTGETTIEPAHEALLRQWGLLRVWLAEDAGLLGVLEGVKRASRDWTANDKDAAWLTHATGRLEAAKSLRKRHDLASNLNPAALEYLGACQRVESAAKWRRRAGLALVIAMLAFIGGGWLTQDRWLPVADVTAYRMLNWIYLEGKRGEEFKDCSYCPMMVRVPKGKFLRGSREGIGSKDERPQSEVMIAKPFAVSKFEVTFAEWDACADAGGCAHRPQDAGWGHGTRPVVNVNWDDAKHYAKWLSERTDQAYRLTTEAEWEYAARGNTDTTQPHPTYSWGNEIGRGNANCRGCGSRWDGKQTAPAGSFKPNAFGLHDMQGNAWEWVEDCYALTYEKAPTDGTAYSSATCGRRIVRGGSWNSNPVNLRIVVRDRMSPSYRLSGNGFRLARTL